jgi:predicted branched-subunit amino acid permease
MSFAQEFARGMRKSPPVVLSSAPFGLLFGALAVDNGFSIGEAVLMSATVYAGASQMVGLDLFGQRVAPWLIALSIFAVNFRHVLYSAAVGRRVPHWASSQRAFGFFFLVDPQYAEAERKAENGERVTFAWFMGMAVPIYLFWVAEAWVGARFGGLIPNTYALGLDFLLPIYFLGLVMSFRLRPLWLPIVATSAVASIVAYETIGSPWHVTVGAVAGMALAAFMPVNGNGNGEDAA